eukprot:970073-Pelagomonas_calceolata.AAC.5
MDAPSSDAAQLMLAVDASNLCMAFLLFPFSHQRNFPTRCILTRTFKLQGRSAGRTKTFPDICHVGRQHSNRPYDLIALHCNHDNISQPHLIAIVLTTKQARVPND